MLGQILGVERDAGRLAPSRGSRKDQVPDGNLVTVGVTKRLSARAAKLAEALAV